MNEIGTLPDVSNQLGRAVALRLQVAVDVEFAYQVLDAHKILTVQYGFMLHAFYIYLQQLAVVDVEFVEDILHAVDIDHFLVMMEFAECMPHD